MGPDDPLKSGRSRTIEYEEIRGKQLEPTSKLLEPFIASELIVKEPSGIVLAPNVTQQYSDR